MELRVLPGGRARIDRRAGRDRAAQDSFAEERTGTGERSERFGAEFQGIARRGIRLLPQPDNLDRFQHSTERAPSLSFGQTSRKGP